MKIDFSGGWADGKVIEFRDPPPHKYYVPVPPEISVVAPVVKDAHMQRIAIHVYELIDGRYLFRDVTFS